MSSLEGGFGGQVLENQEKIVEKPFTIRGHHLPYFQAYLKMIAKEKNIGKFNIVSGIPYTPSYDILAKKVRNVTEDLNDSVWRITCERISKNIGGGHDQVADILGNNKEDADAYERRLSEVFKRFGKLSDNDPIEIVARHDEICGVCHRGEHCKYERSYYHGEGYAKNDTYFLDLFLESASKVGVKQMISITTENVIFKNRDIPVSLNKLKTTVAIFKKLQTYVRWV